MRGGGGCFEFAILAGGEGEGVAVVVIAVVRMVVFGGCGCGGGGWWGRSGGVAGSPSGKVGYYTVIPYLAMISL